LKPFSFVHTADLHLDSPFQGIAQIAPDAQDLLYESTFQAFERIVDLCLERRVDFLLVAGDVYEGPGRNLRAQQKFRSSLERLDGAGIPTFLVHGNHDPLNSWFTTIEWPESVHTFGAETVETHDFEKDGELAARIYGISYPESAVKSNLARRFKREGEAPIHIGLLHCNVGSVAEHEPYAPCSLSDLEETGMDYWALGHIHKPSVLKEREPAVIYSGTPQGRHINESGPRGCYLVEVDGRGRIKPEFVPLDVVRWNEAEVSIESIDGPDAFDRALVARWQEMLEASGGRPLVTRVILTGRGTLHDTFARENDFEAIVEQARESALSLDLKVIVEKVVDQTRPDLDLEALRGAESLAGEFLRLLQEVRQGGTARDEVLASLQELYGKPHVKKVIPAPSEKDLQEIIDAAEALGVDLLVQKDEE